VAAFLPIGRYRREPTPIAAGVEAQPTILQSARQRRPLPFDLAPLHTTTIGKSQRLSKAPAFRHPSFDRLRQNIPRVPLYTVRINESPISHAIDLFR
jgi:hypothetical protein